MTESPALPPSASHFATGYVGLLGFGLVVLLQVHHPLPLMQGVVVLILAPFVAMLAVEWRLRGLPLLAPVRPLGEIAWARLGCKLVGLAGGVGLVAFGYWLFPEYHGRFYQPYWEFLRLIAPWWLVATPFYVWLGDAAQADPEDGAWRFGAVLLGRWGLFDAGQIGQYLLGWLVKGFFLPLMLVYLSNNLRLLTQFAWGEMGRFMTLFVGVELVLYTIDLTFCCIGYLMALRAMDSHIRSVEPTLLGWAAALFCYQPFYSLFERYYVGYADNYTWESWLAPWPWLQAAWGGAALLLLVVYAWATVAFGFRFSNLTHRGIITHGPYRFTKHPAYWTKNLHWWLVAIPFLPHGDWVEALRQSCALLLLNGVYWLRAWTEERHLAWDPDYRTYAAWVDRHGLLARWRGR